MTKRIIGIMLILSLALMTSGCAVVMSAKKRGTSMTKVRESRTRASLLANDGVEIITTKKDEKGKLIYEDLMVEKPTGSTARAVGHGVLDVFTLGIWEVVGTPVEGHMTKKSSTPIRVYYDENENITKIELLQ